MISPRRLTPEEIIAIGEVHDAKHFRRVIWATMIGCGVVGFAIGFVTGFLLK